METRSTVTESSKLDPEDGVWRECQNDHFVNYIRIFFEIGRGTVTSIGNEMNNFEFYKLFVLSLSYFVVYTVFTIHAVLLPSVYCHLSVYLNAYN